MIIKLFLVYSFFLVCVTNGEEIEVKDPIKIVANERNGTATYELFTYSTDTVEQCGMKLPDGKFYEIIPQKNLTDPNIEIVTLYGKDKCGFTILNVTRDYVGDYEIHALIKSMGSYTPNQVLQPLKVVVEEQIAIIPSDTYSAYPGQNIEFSLSEKLDNLIRCEIVAPNNLTDENFSSNFSNCVTKIQNISNKMDGVWTIKAVGDITLFNKVTITVKEFPSIEKNITLAQGVQTTMLLGPTESLFCIAKNPSGLVVAENPGQCIVKIDRVTQKENGVWKVKVGLAGAISTIDYEYNVHVIDMGQQNEGEILTHYEIDKNGEFMKMECVLFVKSMQSCRIVRSDGEVFMLDQGIGNERYKYYKSEKKLLETGNDFVSCGIHIEKPNALDMEPWRCVIVHGDNNTETGSVIDMNQSLNINNTNGNSGISTTSMVNISKSDSFNMICLYPSSISYCWFRAPNGTIFSLLPGASQENYEYYGNGLKMGHCGMTIKSANFMDQGIWKCNVGTIETKDTKKDIFVNIYDTPLVSQRHNYLINRGDSVSCKTFNGSSLEYCRFISPSGEGINPRRDSKLYSDIGTDLDIGHCRLSFLAPTEYDNGIWSCIGKPHFKNVEYYDTFNISLVYQPRTSVMYFVLWVLFVVALLVLVFIFIVTIPKVFRERRRKQTETHIQNDWQKKPLP